MNFLNANFNMQYSLPRNLHNEVLIMLKHWQIQENIEKFWRYDKSLWTNHDEHKWLGWLDLPNQKINYTKIDCLAQDIQKKNIKDIILLGMGGSSLFPGMIANIFRKINFFPRLAVLDSTDPGFINNFKSQFDLTSSFFIISSKSGNTLETNLFFEYFYDQLKKIYNEKVGDYFIAITDPNTSLEKLAIEKKFKDIFLGSPSIGGRYSALSVFGLAPIHLIGIHAEKFIKQATPMFYACQNLNLNENPGFLLGIILGTAAKTKIDKITLIISPKIKEFGVWLEQLIAESTGKDNKGLIPIEDEPLGRSIYYDKDRLFIYIALKGAIDSEQDKHINELSADFPVIRIVIDNTYALAAEIFRFEVAIAIASSIIGINPFNQPNVEESKSLTLEFVKQYQEKKTFDYISPIYQNKEINLFVSDENYQLIKKYMSGDNFTDYLHSFLQLLNKNDYINFSVFLPNFKEYVSLLQKMRVQLRNKKKVATCLGFGPRFLHSTGQIYKGGPNTGLYFQITANHLRDIPIPNQAYTFGTIIDAQAQANFKVLCKDKRRILRIHLNEEVNTGLAYLLASFEEVLLRDK